MRMKEHLSQMREREMAFRYRQLAEHPEIQAEAIAHHYASLASMAMHLRALVKERHYLQLGQSSESLNMCIDRCVNEICTAHERDLGLALEWVKHDVL